MTSRGARGSRGWRSRPLRHALGVVAGCLLVLGASRLAAGPAQPALVERPKARSRSQRLPSPAELSERLPLPRRLRQFVNESRQQVVDVMEGKDDRLMAIVGPCSIHDPKAAREYAHKLREVVDVHSADLLILMRTYLEKPRTSVGWRGLVNDPDLSGKEDLQRGIALGRRVLLDINMAGLPTATEFLDPLVAPFFEDLVTYGSIGARTVESPTHRQMAAALEMPIGFKNGRSGDLTSAANAAVAASAPQRRVAMDRKGHVAATEVMGNPWGHIVLRGSESGPNYGNDTVMAAGQLMAKAGFEGRRVVVDCSHGNSRKKHELQVDACESVAEQVAEGNSPIAGVMIESFLEAGAQTLDPGVTPLADLKYGVSVTDACLGFEATEALLGTLASAARARRKVGLSWREAAGSGDEAAGGQRLAA